MPDTPNSRRDLWRAVLQQAVADAVSEAKDAFRCNNRDRARAWLAEPSDDFDEVCGLADYEPSQVRRSALAYIAEEDARVAAGIPRGEKSKKAPAAPKIPKPTPTPAPMSRRLRPRVNMNKPAPPRPMQRLDFNGLSLTIPEWAARVGITRTALHNRLSKGWPLERALVEVRDPACHGIKPKLITFNDESLTVKQWADRLGITESTLRVRLESPAWTIERALTTENVAGQRSCHLKLEVAA